MRRVWLFAVLMLCGAFLASPAAAAQFTGSYLLQLCDKDEKGKETLAGGHTACQAYILGVIDYHSVLSALKIAPSVDICVPSKATPSDLHDIVLSYMHRHSENDAFIAAPTVTMALYEVFPCKKRRK